MSRLPQAPRTAVLVLLFVVALLGASLPALAQDTNTTLKPAEGKITRILTIGVFEENCPAGLEAPCFDVSRLAANAGDVVVLNGDFTNSDNVHNLHTTEGVTPPVKTKLAPREFHTISFLMPEGEVKVICDAHANTMVLTMVQPAALAAVGGGVSIPGLGVHFLAYWVGIIAFMFLFIVYGATFFLFKYNETTATTDHWDRSDARATNPRLARWANPLALVIAVVAVAAIVYLATR